MKIKDKILLIMAKIWLTILALIVLIVLGALCWEFPFVPIIGGLIIGTIWAAIIWVNGRK